MTPFDPPTLAQISAANPHQSSWVSANAGSGKTRVLTNRVARLLLHGTPPQKILCLTYTKAAAAEMQNRLFERLGEWAMKEDEELRADLLELGEQDEFLQTEQLQRARTLFASALETPGGLKIQTIHSFCDDVLRRFPVEAGVSPQFNIMDDRTAKQVRADILERIALDERPKILDDLARQYSGADIDELLREITSKAARFRVSPTPAAFGITGNETPEGIYSLAISEPDEDRLATHLSEWAKLNSSAQKATIIIKSGLQAEQHSKKLAYFESALLTGKKAKSPFSAKRTFPAAAYRREYPEVVDWLDPLADRIESARQTRLALAAYERTSALHAFAKVFLKHYREYKSSQALLDYDDLIDRAEKLLTTSSMAQWVLYRLDGGIDHILVDEAQDTSPEQWRVIQALFEEFTSGQSASDVDRTLFVVGDEKQSIYSFQGADPVVFGEMQQYFSEKLLQSERQLHRHDLLYSFRSAPPIMRLVDTIFNQTETDLFVENVEHIAFFDQTPGRIDIWPFLEKSTDTIETEWFTPLDSGAPDDVNQKLANQIAGQIRTLLDTGETIQEGNEPPRRVREGDILILVQRRSDLFSHIIRALKNNDINVAGADKFKVGAELAVRDILSLLKFLATPEDDLSLAEALRSPLLGFTESDLFTLAHGRQGVLWAALRDKAHQFEQAHNILHDLNRHTDLLRPYELIERLLSHHNGRENLIARLGAEAEDGIDELLFQAMNFEQIAPPTLTGFLGWFEADEMVAKRQLDSAPDQVRVMTVHGAKGLEAPIVILPETQHRQNQDRNALQEWDGGLIHWKARSDEAGDEQKGLVEHIKHLSESERMRLLYVALTRAKNWLIICGAGKRDKDATCWYDRVDRGVDALSPLMLDIPEIGKIKSVQNELWQKMPHMSGDRNATTATDRLPSWLLEKAPRAAQKDAILNPSKLSGAKALAGEGLDTDAATARGTQIHLLLEKLPNTESSVWPTTALSILRGLNADISENEIDLLLAEASTVLTAPNLAHLFADGTMAEVPIATNLPSKNDVRLYGVIDRLIVTPETVLAIDYKSNAVVPTSADQIPDGLLAQMGAYREALSQIYKDREINISILWTKTAQLMSIPHKLVIDALDRAEHLDDSHDHS